MKPLVQGTLRVVVGLAGLASVGLAVARLLEVWTAEGHVDHFLLGSTLHILSWGVGFAALALAIAWRGSPTGAVYIGGGFFAAFSAAWSLMALLERPFELVPFVALGGISYALAIQFTQRYPRRLVAADIGAVGGRWFQRSIAWPLKLWLRPALYFPTAVAVETVVHGTHNVVLGLLHVLLWLGLAGAYLYVGYRRGTEDARSRLYWIFEGVLVMLVIELTEFALWGIHQLGIAQLNMAPVHVWLTALQGTAGLTCFALAMFWAGAFDSRLVLRKTAVVSATAGLVVILFIALEELLLDLAAEQLNLESRLTAIASGVLAALAFRPISSRVDRLIRARAN